MGLERMLEEGNSQESGSRTHGNLMGVWKEHGQAEVRWGWGQGALRPTSSKLDALSSKPQAIG